MVHTPDSRGEYGDLWWCGGGGAGVGRVVVHGQPTCTCHHCSHTDSTAQQIMRHAHGGTATRPALSMTDLSPTTYHRPTACFGTAPST